MKKTRLDPHVLRRLRVVYHSATPEQHGYGMQWYTIARDVGRELAEEFGTSLSVALGVIAALSPGNPWDRNLGDARLALSAHAWGRAVPAKLGVYGRLNIEKCERILGGEPPLEVLGGDKVTSFYRNLMGIEDGAVTVDRHAKGAAKGVRGDKETTVSSPKEYRDLAEHYRRVAGEVGIAPSQLQAVVWVVWRDGKGA